MGVYDSVLERWPGLSPYGEQSAPQLAQHGDWSLGSQITQTLRGLIPAPAKGPQA